VYPAADQPRVKPLSAADTRIAGFVGLAARGPLNEPVYIGGWNEFLDIYGTSPDGFLARSVEGFFLNGGKCCYVVRVAHLPKAGGALKPEHAACAERVMKDGWDKPTIRARALNEGRWGNNIWVRTQQATAAKTLLTLDIEVGAGEARVNSVKGFERGALVRVYDRENSDYIIITEIEDRTVRWASSTPIVRKYRAAGPTFLEVIEFEVYASLRDRREVFRGLQLSPLSRRYAPRIVNDESRLIRLEDMRSPAPLPKNLPVPAPAAKLAGGRDGHDVLTAEDFIGHDHGPGDRTGLMSLGAVEQVAMLSVPDALLAHARKPGPEADQLAQRIHDAMVMMCENLKDRFALLDLPPIKDIEEVRKWRRRYDTSYAALYYPWIGISGQERHHMPPSGHIAGIVSRCDTDVGVHKALANEVIHGANGLSISLNEEHLGMLNGDGVNALRSFPGRGIRVWGARTCTDDPDWRYVNVRRLFIMLRRSLEEGTQWTVYEPNEPVTWQRLSREIGEFLNSLFEKGYFAGNEPGESFYVKCDETTNPAEDRDAGRMVIQIGVAPAVPTEYIVFDVVQKIGDDASQAAGE
jgi:hypothetical protein